MELNIQGFILNYKAEKSMLLTQDQYDNEGSSAKNT